VSVSSFAGLPRGIVPLRDMNRAQSILARRSVHFIISSSFISVESAQFNWPYRSLISSGCGCVEC
jgi:hypothetical protein